MNVGVIYTAFNTADLIEMSLRPWIDARLNKLSDHEYVICAVCVPFIGFQHDSEDGTLNQLRLHQYEGYIDNVISEPRNIPEVTARGMALKYLVQKGCDLIVQWDSDEGASEEDITAILSYIEANPYIDAFRFSYRNLVFTPNQWLADPFTPMRAHRVKVDSYVADHFWDDNNVMYRGTITRDFKRDVSLATLTIPASVSQPAHHTWLSDTPENSARSKAKESYQRARGWQCSFSWDPVKGLIFNPALPAPKVLRDSEP